MGWSNGGFLTNALIAATDRFKAASSGAGVLDQSLQWAVEDTPGHVVNFMGAALPWQDPERYLKGSPLYGLASATTPTVIHVGGSDPRVPPEHSRGLYRALKIYLGVPTELVVYPGAHHGLTTYTHRKAKMAWDLAWFERYLGPGWQRETPQ
jgi:dipeptidyl aminopeptidase/acylaminoacyl peptidase